MSIKALRQRKADLVKRGRDILGTADENGKLTAENEAAYAAVTSDLQAVNGAIEREEQQMEAERGLQAVSMMTAEAEKELQERAASAAAETGQQGAKDTFQTFGHFLQAVAHAESRDTKRDEWDKRLHSLFRPGTGYRSGPTGANEAVGSEGGFLVERQSSTALLDMMHEMGDIMGLVRRIPITVGDGIKLPAIDETSRVNGSRWGGVQAYWANEADTVTSSKPKFREIEMSLKKLFGLGYATEELLRDSTALETVMRAAFVEELTFKTEDGFVNGTGAGQPLGWLNSGAVITIAAESGQATQTVVTANILNMWARLPKRSRRTAVWLVNQDVEPQLYSLTLGSGTAVILLYTPPGVNGNNSPYGLLMGRPVIPVEYAATLGTAGDVQLVDPTQYLAIDKDGIQQASSMHVRFIYDEMTFKFTYRVDGQPAWKQAVTPYKGSKTQSPFIVLGTR